MRILQNHFGDLKDQPITAFTLQNDQGMEVTSLNYGCIITKILVPDQNGMMENVVLGFDSMEEYERYSPYFGAVIGRFAGRIKNAEFELDGRIYRLAKNDHGNHLHGGLHGFDKVVWKTEIIERSDQVGLEFTYLSEDGEEGYPGNLYMKVAYTLTNENELIISYSGRSDYRTLLNVTNHSYFNLSGNLKRDILHHRLTLKSDQFLELDEKLVPTGKILAVDDTPFDFREGREIIDGVHSTHPQNILAGYGYDHPFLLAEHHNEEILLFDEESGRLLTVETDQPVVVLYTGNQLLNTFAIRGVPSRKYLGLCLETQGYPDSVHHPHFPSNMLEKDEEFHSVTKYKFDVKG
ncbi:aldose epimerase family protein [Thermicanus aegyptius]|uniref:aldose epimerase family protein n=1 Tax=Thermicanus aegyptius TaxID=94009 RepID=UPI00041BEE33|nr:aldose epimerase family protein [Thermicanus aegyptius]